MYTPAPNNGMRSLLILIGRRSKSFILDDGAPVEFLQFYTAKQWAQRQGTLTNNAPHLTTARVQKEGAIAGERER